jgi:adenylate cyclase
VTRPIEIERKFRVLLDTCDWASRYDALFAWEMWQGYLTASDSDTEVRVRRSLELARDSLTEFHPSAALDDLGQQTVVCRIGVKRDVSATTRGGLSRHEVEAVVDEEFFTEAWECCAGRRLRKVRVEYMIDVPPGGRRVIVVDAFKDRLDGLTIAEVEFDDWDASRRFVAPDFLGREVTHDARYRNINLASANRPPEQ